MTQIRSQTNLIKLKKGLKMASSYLQKFPVPEEFPEILADLTKAILKEQPADIIEYSYHYFKNKVEVIH